MKYCFCYQAEKILTHETGKDARLAIEDENGRTVVACGPWRDTPDEAEKDRKLYLSDRDAFFRLIRQEKV